MKKNWLYLLLTLFVSFQLVGCAEEDDDDELYTIGKEFDGAYLGTLNRTYSNGEKTSVPQKIYVTKSTRDEMVDLTMRFLVVDGRPNLRLTVNEVSATTKQEGGVLQLSTIQTVVDTQNNIEYDITIDGTIDGKVLEMNATLDFKTPVEWGKIDSSFKGEITTSTTGSEADILGLGFIESEQIINADGTRSYADTREIWIAVNKEVSEDDLKALTPIYNLSEGATVNPPTGTVFDFTNPVEIQVTSADRVLTRNYTLHILERPTKMTFDEWEPANNKLPEVNQYFIPSTNQDWLKWASSDVRFARFMHHEVNPANEIDMIKPLDQLCVQPTTDAKSGKAAKIMTQMARAQSVYAIPAIANGMLYTGHFGYKGQSVVAESLFGAPIHYKPTQLKGFYKYTKGDTYYEAIFPNAPYEVEEVSKENQFIIRAVLYSVSNRFDDTSVLTYNELFSSDKIVATAELTSSAPKSSYTEFDLPFVYTKEFSYKNDYRIALMFTSSSETQIYSGAPGSILYIDDVEIITD